MLSLSLLTCLVNEVIMLLVSEAVMFLAVNIVNVIGTFDQFFVTQMLIGLKLVNFFGLSTACLSCWCHQ